MNKNNIMVLLLSVLVITMATALLAQTKMTKGKRTMPTIERLKPDLAIDKIYLDKECKLTIVIKNLGPGNLPDGAYVPKDPKYVKFLLKLEWQNGSNSQSLSSLEMQDKFKKLKKAGAELIVKPITLTQNTKVTVKMYSRRLLEVSKKNNKMTKQLSCEIFSPKKR